MYPKPGICERGFYPPHYYKLIRAIQILVLKKIAEAEYSLRSPQGSWGHSRGLQFLIGGIDCTAVSSAGAARFASARRTPSSVMANRFEPAGVTLSPLMAMRSEPVAPTPEVVAGSAYAQNCETAPFFSGVATK